MNDNMLRQLKMRKWMMVIGLSFIICHLSFSEAQAQPKARRQQAQKEKTQQQQQKTQNQGISQRARLMYPTSLDMPEDVVWRRDIYREINLDDESNSGLYYPTEPIDKQMNLFTYLFKLALNNYIPVYEYRLDGNESFSDSSKVAMKTLLDNYHIFYENRDGKLRVENSDIPSAEVKMYYLKESAYYDQSNAQFRRKVMALCPVMVREDDFGGEAAKYPLFWVKYTDLEPFLSRQSVAASDLNNAATMTLEDFFTLNHYQGKIYKAGNRMSQPQQRPQFGEFTAVNADSIAKQQQQKIEAELLAFEQGVFGQKKKEEKVDSLGLGDADKKAKKKSKSRRNSEKSSKKSKAKQSKDSGSSSSSSSAPRVSVRRQRH